MSGTGHNRLNEHFMILELKIPQSTFPKFTKFADRRILRLWTCEKVGRSGICKSGGAGNLHTLTLAMQKQILAQFAA